MQLAKHTIKRFFSDNLQHWQNVSSRVGCSTYALPRLLAHTHHARALPRDVVFFCCHICHTLPRKVIRFPLISLIFSPQNPTFICCHALLHPHNTPFCAGQSTFSAKSGTFSVKSRTFSKKQGTFFGKSRTFFAKSGQKTHRLKPTFGTNFHTLGVKSITFAKKGLYRLTINILPQQCDRCDSKKQ